jgi:hypothetical protein
LDPKQACLANCELFGKYADYFESHVVPLWGAVYDELVSRAKISPGQRLLDVGTGTGEVALRRAIGSANGGPSSASTRKPRCSG